MNILRLGLVMLCSLVPISAVALIHGQETPAQEVATVSLQLKHRHWLQSVNAWEGYQSLCSGVIVGKQPLTVLTAAHCFKEADIEQDTRLPNILITNQSALGISSARLVKAFYKPFDAVEKNLALDVAVLVFAATLSDSVKVMPVYTQALRPNPDTQTNICGFGAGYQEAVLEYPRCSQKPLLHTLVDFSQIMPQQYEALDAMLYIKARAQFEYKQSIVKSLNTLVAVHRLDAQGRYSTQLAMPTSGDSGGPWIMQYQSNKKGSARLKHQRRQLAVVAITSLVERFYNKSPYWDFFNIDEPLSDFPYVAYGIRLGHTEVLHFLNQAIRQGADIQFAAP